MTDQSLKTSTDNWIGVYAEDPDAPSATMTYSWNCKFRNSTPCQDANLTTLSLAALVETFNNRQQSTLMISQGITYFKETEYIFSVSVSSSSGKTGASWELILTFSDLPVCIVCPTHFDSGGFCLLPSNPELVILTGEYTFVEWKETGGGYTGTVSGSSDRYKLLGGYWGEEDQGANSGQVCATVKDRNSMTGRTCIKIKGVKAPTLEVVTKTKIIEGGVLDVSRKIEVGAAVLEFGSQDAKVPGWLHPYTFSFGYCTLFYKNRCVGLQHMLPYSDEVKASLAVPYIETKLAFSLALVVIAKDSLGIEHQIYWPFKPLPPQAALTASTQTVLESLASREAYFYNLLVLLYSSQAFDPQALLPFCTSLMGPMASRLSEVNYPSTRTAISCFIECESRLNTKIDMSLMDRFSNSLVPEERRLVEMAGKASSIKTEDPSYFKSVGGVFLGVAKGNEKDFKAEIYSEDMMGGVEGTWGEWIEGTKSWTSIYLAGREVFEGGVNLAGNYKLNTSKRIEEEGSGKIVEGVAFASFRVFNFGKEEILVANLSKPIHILFPAPVSQVYVDGMQPFCERMMEENVWKEFGRFSTYNPEELGRQPIPTCSVEKTGVYRVSLKRIETDSDGRGSGSIWFYKSYLFYLEVFCVICCFISLSRAQSTDRLSGKSRSDFLKCLSSSFQVQFSQGELKMKNSITKADERIYLFKMIHLQVEESKRYLDVMAKQKKIANKKKLYLAKEKIKSGTATRSDMDFIAQLVQEEMKAKEMKDQLNNGQEEISEEEEIVDDAIFFDYVKRKKGEINPNMKSNIAPETRGNGNEAFVNYVQDEDDRMSISTKGSSKKYSVMNRKVISFKYKNGEKKKNFIDKSIFGMPSHYDRKASPTIGVDQKVQEIEDKDGKKGTVISDSNSKLKVGKNRGKISKGANTNSTETLSDQLSVKSGGSGSGKSPKKKMMRKLNPKFTKPAPSLENETSPLPEKNEEIDYENNESLRPLEGERQKLVSISDIYLYTHKLFGLFYFKDPFNLTTIRMLIVLNQYLFFFIVSGLISIYTLRFATDSVKLNNPRKRNSYSV